MAKETEIYTKEKVKRLTRQELTALVLKLNRILAAEHRGGAFDAGEAQAFQAVLDEKRYRQLRNWEEYLYENGYRMVKVFLNVSKETQRKRFLERIERDEKHWKLSTADMKERAEWDAYDRAYEDCINATATEHSPWYVLPADTKWYTRYLMSQILVDTLTEMDPQFPPIDPQEAAKIPQVMEQLEAD